MIDFIIIALWILTEIMNNVIIERIASFLPYEKDSVINRIT